MTPISAGFMSQIYDRREGVLSEGDRRNKALELLNMTLHKPF